MSFYCTHKDDWGSLHLLQFSKSRVTEDFGRVTPNSIQDASISILTDDLPSDYWLVHRNSETHDNYFCSILKSSYFFLPFSWNHFFFNKMSIDLLNYNQTSWTPLSTTKQIKNFIPTNITFCVYKSYREAITALSVPSVGPLRDAVISPRQSFTLLR